jgi:hypothetical protein
VKTLKAIRQLVRDTLHRFVRHPNPWDESMLITEHGTVYTIRDRAGCEREIQHPRTGKWERESRVTFSQLPMYENYHRDQYKAAKPYTLNPGADRTRHLVPGTVEPVARPS